MKIPQSSPPVEVLFKEKISPKRLIDIMKHNNAVDDKGRYLHWDELRYKTPPEDLSIEEWWAGFHFARHAAAQKLPFSDTQKRRLFYTEPPELRNFLRAFDMNAGGILGGGQHSIAIQDGQRYLRKSLAEEPFHSSLIEGAATTRDIAKKMIFDNRKPKTRDERMVLNNYKGMEFIKDISGEDLTLAHLLELHRIITEDTLDDPTGAGRLRTSDDQVDVYDESTGETLHMPPNADDLPERLETLLSFANENNNERSYHHPLIRAITLHFMLAYDHPFIDGNGRTARALFYWLLLREGYWMTEYTSISSIIAQAPTAYYKAFLMSETSDGDITYFLLHQANVVNKALERIHQYADEKKRETESFHEIIKEQKQAHPLNERQVELIQSFILKREKTMQVSTHQKRYSVSYLTARNDLENLVERGLVRKTKEGRSSIYRPSKNLDETIPRPPIL